MGWKGVEYEENKRKEGKEGEMESERESLREINLKRVE